MFIWICSSGLGAACTVECNQVARAHVCVWVCSGCVCSVYLSVLRDSVHGRGDGSCMLASWHMMSLCWIAEDVPVSVISVCGGVVCVSDWASVWLCVCG